MTTIPSSSSRPKPVRSATGRSRPARVTTLRKVTLIVGIVVVTVVAAGCVSGEAESMSQLAGSISSPMPDGGSGDGDASAGVETSTDAGQYDSFTPPELEVEPGTEPEVRADADAAGAADVPGDGRPLADRVDDGYLDQAPEFERLAMATGSCEGLTEVYLATYQGVLDRLAGASRSDTERIDQAMESFGAGGRLMVARYDELGCTQAQRSAVACQAAARLEADGEVAEDMVAMLDSSCVASG